MSISLPRAVVQGWIWLPSNVSDHPRGARVVAKLAIITMGLVVLKTAGRRVWGVVKHTSVTELWFNVPVSCLSGNSFELLM